jgi:hypothetical protein
LLIPRMRGRSKCAQPVPVTRYWPSDLPRWPFANVLPGLNLRVRQVLIRRVCDMEWWSAKGTYPPSISLSGLAAPCPAVRIPPMRLAHAPRSLSIAGKAIDFFAALHHVAGTMKRTVTTKKTI